MASRGSFPLGEFFKIPTIAEKATTSDTALQP
jgi:hypothetical protein